MNLSSSETSINSGPIFIGGLDRSGKTPLGLMLTCHPRLSLTRRTYMWTRFYSRYGDLSQVDHFERCLSAMIAHPPIRQLEPDLEQIRCEFWEGEPTYARLFALFHQQYAQKAGKPRWIDQLAFVEYYADPIFAAFPNARMIHMIRHPVQRLGVSIDYKRPRKGKVGSDIARWLYSVRLARRNQQRYPGRYKIIQYENLFRQPEETLRQILSFLGEDFDPVVLNPRAGMAVGSRDSNESDKDKPGEGSTDEKPWKGVSNGDITFVQTFAGSEMSALGYSINRSFRNQLSDYFIDWPANLAGAVLWAIRKDKRIRMS